MLGHAALCLMEIAVYNSVYQPLVLVINIPDRLIFLHDIVPGPGNAVLNQLVSSEKNTVKHRIVCNLCNFLMKLFVKLSSCTLVLSIFQIGKNP